MGLRTHFAFLTGGNSGRLTGCRAHQSESARSSAGAVEANHRTAERTVLRQNILDDFAVYIGQAHVAAAEAEGEFFVIHAQQVQHGGVQIMDL